MADFKNFSFKNVSAIFGPILFEGFAEGDDVIVIESTQDQFSMVVGAQGDVIRTQTSDNSCTCTIKLLQTSNTNEELTVKYIADRRTGLITEPLLITDRESGEVYSINNAWIKRFPTVTRGQNPNSMDWIFDGDFLTPALTLLP
jgi:hypothetical protein